MNHSSADDGYEIQLLKGNGYILNIFDRKKFDLFMRHSQKVIDHNRDQRLQVMLFFILYFTS